MVASTFDSGAKTSVLGSRCQRSRFHVQVLANFRFWEESTAVHEGKDIAIMTRFHKRPTSDGRAHVRTRVDGSGNGPSALRSCFQRRPRRAATTPLKIFAPCDAANGFQQGIVTNEALRAYSLHHRPSQFPDVIDACQPDASREGLRVPAASLPYAKPARPQKNTSQTNGSPAEVSHLTM